MSEWRDIATLTPSSRGINLRFFVMDMKHPRRIFSKRTGKENELLECIVGDSSGKITLVLWNEDVDSVKLHQTYELRNGCVNLYDECMTLSQGRLGQISESEVMIKETNNEIDMSRPFMGKKRRKTRSRSPTGRTFDGATGTKIRKFCGRKSF